MYAALPCDLFVIRLSYRSFRDSTYVSQCPIDMTTIKRHQHTSSHDCNRCANFFCVLTVYSCEQHSIHRLLVLTSQRRQRPVAFSLTTPAPAPTPGEAAVIDLLRIVRNPRPQAQILNDSGPTSPLSRAPSFLSGGLPRDRRGRIAHKQTGKNLDHLARLRTDDGEDNEERHGDETPRNAPSSYMAEVERERGREFLEALKSVFSCIFFYLNTYHCYVGRSPDVENTAARASVGGWGLGAGHEDTVKTVDEEEEEEPLDWDQTQVHTQNPS